MNDSCIFCKIIQGTLPSTIVWQDDDIIVIKDIHPKAPIHNLIIPKKHFHDLLALPDNDTALAHKMFVEVPKKLVQLIPNVGSFNCVVNNGVGAGQIIFHLHIHFLSGKKLFDL